MTPLDRLRNVEVADVLKGDQHAATLRRTPSGITFAYEDAYLAASGAAVATSLAPSAVPVLTPAGAVPTFFAGLLPEGPRLTALREAVKTSGDDHLTLLLAVGADLIGDVRVLVAGERPPIPEPTIVWSDTADPVFRDLISSRGMVERHGMAGVQPKASAAMITVPARAFGREAILKLTPPEYPHLIENEAWFLGLAQSIGISVPRFRVIVDRVGEKGLLIERFDRREHATAVERLAVEDGAQVLDLNPADKYRVTTEEVVTALARTCAATRVAALTLLRMTLFAWLTGNGDLHAKNLSIIQHAGEWRVAPAYDLPSSLPYGDHTMALTIAGRQEGLSRRAFLEFADAIDLPVKTAQRTIDELLKATEPVLHLFREGSQEFTRAHRPASVRQLQYRRRILAR
jgi:serine/threonine-protein kinase HipA